MENHPKVLRYREEQKKKEEGKTAKERGEDQGWTVEDGGAEG